jgi:ribonuclease HI
MHIREVKTQFLAPRMSTMKMLETVREDVAATFGRYVTDTDIWKAAAVKDILPQTSQFLWKGLHNAHRIGKYWNHIPECEDHATCKDCDVLEDLEHILLRCASPGQEIVWQAAESLRREKESHWPVVSRVSLSNLEITK